MEMGQYTAPSKILRVRAKEFDSLLARCLNRKADRRASCRELLESISSIEHGTKPGLKKIDLQNLKLITSRFSKYFWAIPFVIVVLILFIIGITRQPSKRDNSHALQDSIQTDSVKINVLNANNAKIVFPDQSSYAIPHTIIGEKTEQTSFTLSAPGYEDLEVSLELNQRRKTFEYVLQKKAK